MTEETWKQAFEILAEMVVERNLKIRQLQAYIEQLESERGGEQ